MEKYAVCEAQVLRRAVANAKLHGPRLHKSSCACFSACFPCLGRRPLRGGPPPPTPCWALSFLLGFI